MIFELLHYLCITSIEREVFLPMLSLLTLDMGCFVLFFFPGKFVISLVYTQYLCT